MALIRCPDCDKEISDSARACVSCGRPMQQANDLKETKNSANAVNSVGSPAALLCCLLIILLMSCDFPSLPTLVATKQEKSLKPNPATPRVLVTGVTINKKHSNAWFVTGSIRNLGSYPIQGHVKIKFLSANGDITKSASTFVNAGDSLKPDQSASFEYAARPEDFHNVVNFDVIFVDSKN